MARGGCIGDNELLLVLWDLNGWVESKVQESWRINWKWRIMLDICTAHSLVFINIPHSTFLLLTCLHGGSLWYTSYQVVWGRHSCYLELKQLMGSMDTPNTRPTPKIWIHAEKLALQCSNAFQVSLYTSYFEFTPHRACRWSRTRQHFRKPMMIQRRLHVLKLLTKPRKYAVIVYSRCPIYSL